MVMDWEPHPLKEIETWVLDEIFDRARGWEIPEEQVPVKRILAKGDGNPNYILTVDSIEIYTYEIHRWIEGSGARSVSAGRLCTKVQFTGITIQNMQPLLTDTYQNNGLPSYGIGQTGQPTLHAAFPIAPKFPADIARRQLMVCMGNLAEVASELLVAWSKNSAQSKNSPQSQRPVDWDRAKNVASVAGTLLRSIGGMVIHRCFFQSNGAGWFTERTDLGVA